MQNEIKEFIKQNSCEIYEYINTEVLKDIGKMNSNYFIKVIQNILDKSSNIEINENNPNILPYLIFTLLSDRGKIDYTSLRAETIDFKHLNKESSTYYNYARFSLKDEYLLLELMQSKFGGMPVDEDIVKFEKKIPIKNNGLEIFITQNKEFLESTDTYNNIKKEINSLY